MVADSQNMPDVFHRCNMDYFEGKLIFPRFRILHSFRTCGCFEYTKGGWLDKTINDPVIRITDYYDFTPEQFVDIMVHEMIHYYLAWYGIDRRCSHGKAFCKMASELNLNYRLNITSTTDVSKFKRREGTSNLWYWLSTAF